MKILAPILLLASCLLTGCVSGELTKIQTALPANSFDKIQIGFSVGPVSHTLTLSGGVKNGSSMEINSVEAATTVMGWGSRLEITNLRIEAPLAPTPAGLPVTPAPGVQLVAIKPTP